MNYHFLLPVLLALGLPAVAQSNLSRLELQRIAVRACEEDKVCLFGVVEQQFNDGLTADELASPWPLIGLIFGGIDAAMETERLDQKLDILDRAIQLLDDNYHDPDIAFFPSSPLHLLRAELCLRINDEDCYLESAALLMEREIASREEGIRDEQFRARSRDANTELLSPPIRWSDIQDIRYDNRSSGLREPDWGGEIGSLLNKAGSGTVETRIDAILSEYERRSL